MKGLNDLIGNLMILYVLIVATALNFIDWGGIAAVILNFGTGGHENVSELRNNLSPSDRSGTYPW